jgi:hypothetical protein
MSSKIAFVEGEGLFPTIAAQDEWASVANWQLGQSRSQCKKKDFSESAGQGSDR